MQKQQSPKVLIVDDEPLVLLLYTDLLANNGFDVTSERSPTVALNRLSKGEHFDLLITDIMMAELNGWDLIRNIREVLKIDEVTLPVIIVSAYDSSTKEFEAFKYRANAYLVKKGSAVVELLRQANLLVGKTGEIRQ